MTLYDKIAALDGIRGQSANAVRVISELRFADSCPPQKVTFTMN